MSRTLWPRPIRRLLPDRVFGLIWDVPTLPILTSVLRWKREVFARSGAHVNVGAELYWRMHDAGLIPNATPLAEVPLDIGPGSVVCQRHAAVIRSVLPKIIEYGLATESEVDIETLEQRLREEAVAECATIPGDYLLVGQWAQKPTTG